MRAFAWLVVFASGCSLYFGRPSSSTEIDAPVPPDAGAVVDALDVPDAAVSDGGTPPEGSLARCEDGQIHVVAITSTGVTQPRHGSGRVIGQCQGSCRSAAAFCSTADCASAVQTLCDAPISRGATCSLDGAPCQGNGSMNASIDCPETTACSDSVPGATCACRDGAYVCVPVTAAPATQAQIVGKWRGVVTPPAGFPVAWPITLWIYPDGTYWAECAGGGCAAALWFTPDGPSPRRKITVLSTLPLQGSWADITVDFGYSPPPVGQLSALTVNDTTLRFTITPGYVDCGQPTDVTLVRDAPRP